MNNKTEGYLLIPNKNLDRWKEITKNGGIDLFQTQMHTIENIHIHSVFQHISLTDMHTINNWWIPNLNEDKKAELLKKASSAPAKK